MEHPTLKKFVAYLTQYADKLLSQDITTIEELGYLKNKIFTLDVSCAMGYRIMHNYSTMKTCSALPYIGSKGMHLELHPCPKGYLYPIGEKE